MKNSSKKKFWFWGIGILFLLIGLWHLVTNLYREEEKQLRSQLRERVIEKFPEQTGQFFQTFGLFSYSAERETPVADRLSRRSIVLVHGLDDPGKVWQNLAPVLKKEKFNVWLMHYPNDQPVVESALFFY